jgi:hypothetical protein
MMLSQQFKHRHVVSINSRALSQSLSVLCEFTIKHNINSPSLYVLTQEAINPQYAMLGSPVVERWHFFSSSSRTRRLWRHSSPGDLYLCVTVARA